MGKVKVSNGKETFEIDGADLSAAVKEGYKPTEKIIVANSKTNESYEIDPQDVESAMGEGFSFKDVVQKNNIPKLDFTKRQTESRPSETFVNQGQRASVATAAKAKNVETVAAKNQREVQRAKEALNKHLTENKDITTTLLRESRQGKADAAALDRYANVPRSDMPNPLAASVGQVAPQEQRAYDQDVSDEEVQQAQSRIESDEMYARPFLQEVSTRKKNPQLQADMYLLDRNQQMEQGGNQEATHKVLKNAEEIKKGKLAYNIKSGALERPEGFLDSLVTGVKARHQQMSDYEKYQDDDQKVIEALEAERTNIDPDEPIPTPKGTAGGIGSMFGTEYATLGKGAIASVGSTMAGAPEASPFVAAAINSPEYYQRGYSTALKQSYNELRNQGKSPEDALKLAQEQAKTEANLSVAEGVVSSVIGGRMGLRALPKYNLSGGFKAAVGSLFKKTAHYAGETTLDGLTDGLVAGYLQNEKNKAAKEKGMHRNDEQDIRDNVEGELMFSLAMGGITKAAKTAVAPSTYKSLLYYIGKQPDAAIDAKIGEMVQEGKITEEEATEVKGKIQAQKEIDKQIPEDVEDESRMEIQNKIEKRKEVEAKLESTDDAFKPDLKEDVKKINEEIVALSKNKKTLTEEEKAVRKGIKEGNIPDVLAEQAKANPASFLKMLAEQATGTMSDGQQSSLGDAEGATRQQFGDYLVDKALKMYSTKPTGQETVAETPTIKDKDGNSFDIQQTTDDKGHITLKVVDKSGKFTQDNLKGDESVGSLTLLKDQDGYFPQSVTVNEGLRRKGIASKLFDYAEQDLGLKIKPTEDLSEDGKAFMETRPSQIKIDTVEDLENELVKVVSNEKKAKKQKAPKVEQATEPVAKEETVGPALEEMPITEKQDFAYKNSWPVYSRKYPSDTHEQFVQNSSYTAKAKKHNKKIQSGLPKLGDYNLGTNKRDTEESTNQYTPSSIIQNSREFYGDDPLISRVLDFLQPIIEANPNIKIDTGFDWAAGQYEGQKITNDALGYSFPSGNILLNFDKISDYDTLYRTALHEMVHAATRSEINTNQAFNDELKIVLADVRKAMNLPEGDSVVEALVRNNVISQDYDSRYGATNEHELLAEVFTNEKFFNFLKGLEYKGDSVLRKLFLAIAKFFSDKYKQITGAKEEISVDNLADYLMSLTESVVNKNQQESDEGGALPQLKGTKTDELLVRIAKKALDKISEQDVREKLKQIANLDDATINDVIEAAKQVQAATTPTQNTLTKDQIGELPEEIRPKNLLRKKYEKYFTSAKGLPKWILPLRDSASGETQLEIRRALQLMNQTKDIANKIGFSEWKTFDKAIREQYYGSDLTALKALPPEMQIQAVAMRNKIDGLSRDLIINNYVTPEQALNIESNIGEYMTRTYRAYNEKNWGKKVPKKAKDDAYRFLVQDYFTQADPDEFPTQDEAIAWAKDQAEKKLYEIIDGIDDKYVPTKTAVNKGKDLSILKQRKDVPKEIRELLGEYTDPGVNFAMTIARLASLKSSAAYLTKLKEQGLGNIFFEQDSKPREASVQIASEGSDTWNPLNGLWTTPEVKEIFKEVDNEAGEVAKLYLKIIGAIRWGKTVGSVVTQVKNFESNIGFALMNGHYKAGKSGKSFKYLKDKLFGGDKSTDDLIEKVIGLGVIGQSVGVRELKSMFQKDNVDDVILDATTREKSGLRKLAAKVGKPIEYLNKVYAASDDFWKIYGFLNEADALSQNQYGKTYEQLTPDQQSQIDIEASERVKNTYPTYDRVWEGARYLSKNAPIFGNFLSFQAESFRVLRNSVSYAIKDLKSPDKKVLGAKRLAGIASYLTARSTILYTISQLTGVGMAGLWGLVNDDEEDQRLQDINKFVPPFTRSGDKLVQDKGNGEYTVYDVGALEPYTVFKVMNAMTEGNDKSEDPGVYAAAAQLLAPYIEEEMVFKTLLEVNANQTEYGGQIYNELDPFGNKMYDVSAYIAKKLRPSTIDFIQRIVSKEDKGNEVAAIFGGRGYDVDVAKGFSFKLKAASDLFDANKAALNKVKYNPSSTKEEIAEAEDLYDQRQSTLISKLNEDYEAAIRLGADVNKLEEALARKKFFQGYNKKTKHQIKTGVQETAEKAAEPEIKQWKP